MKAYLLLLRAINVGGRHKVSMADLKLLLITLGLERVKSYINSGNLYFESYHDKDDLYGLLKALFNSHYDFPIPFVIIEKQTLTEEYSAYQNGGTRIILERMSFFFFLASPVMKCKNGWKQSP